MTVDIDLEQKTIIHRCPIWAKSILEKFCPHITRMFLMVDPERARTLLSSIHSGLSDWKFESKLAVEFPTRARRLFTSFHFWASLEAEILLRLTS